MPAILVITEDLIETIKKMSTWKIIDMKFPVKFRGETHIKGVAYNSYPEIENLMTKALEEYLK